jgi:hypothetical protein
MTDATATTTSSTWYHGFDENGPMKKFSMATETWYMRERQTPNVSAGPTPKGYNPPYIIPNPDGAICSGTQLRCTSSEYAFVNYFNYEISPRWLVVYRNGFMDDFEGQRRTGYKTPYYETTLSTTYWVGEAIEVRPKVTLEHSFTVKACDANNVTGKAGSQPSHLRRRHDLPTTEHPREPGLARGGSGSPPPAYVSGNTEGSSSSINLKYELCKTKDSGCSGIRGKLESSVKSTSLRSPTRMALRLRNKAGLG